MELQVDEVTTTLGKWIRVKKEPLSLSTAKDMQMKKVRKPLQTLELVISSKVVYSMQFFFFTPITSTPFQPAKVLKREVPES